VQSTLFPTALLYMFWLLSTLIIRSTLTVFTASVTCHTRTTVQLRFSKVAEIELGHVWGR